MWRQREKYRKARKIADELRSHPRCERQTPALSEHYQGIAHAYLAAFEQTNAPFSRKGILRYLLLVATKRPKTYAALLSRCLDYQDPQLSADKKAFGAFLEKLLVDALDEWVEP